MLQSAPLPRGYRVSTDPLARFVVSLAALPGTIGPPSPSAAMDAGPIWLAAPLSLADPRFDISPAEAAKSGIEPLEDIQPPLRAARINGLWPGQANYAFEYRLALSIRAARGRVPRRLSTWLTGCAANSRSQEERPRILSATGDLETGAGGSANLLAGEPGLRRLISPELLAALRGSDILAGNLEGQITARGTPDPTKRYRFRFPPGSGAGYRSMGFDILLLANNHSMDFGPQGLLDTFSDLSSAGIPYVGAGATAREAELPKAAAGPEAKGILFVGLGTFPTEALGFSAAAAAAGASTPGISVDLDRCVAAIRAAAQSGAFVVALVHGGVEFSSRPDRATRNRFRALADAGASLVIGSHPHVVQGVEARGTSLIAYSLGNFLFTDRVMPPEAQSSALISFLLYRGRVRGLDILPVLVSPAGTSLDPNARAAKLGFAALCAALGTSP